MPEDGNTWAERTLCMLPGFFALLILPEVWLLALELKFDSSGPGRRIQGSFILDTSILLWWVAVVLDDDCIVPPVEV